jgi:hypothetical protein
LGIGTIWVWATIIAMEYVCNTGTETTGGIANVSIIASAILTQGTITPGGNGNRFGGGGGWFITGNTTGGNISEAVAGSDFQFVVTQIQVLLLLQLHLHLFGIDQVQVHQMLLTIF